MTYLARPVSPVPDVRSRAKAERNIHWFVPVDGPATIFDTVVSGLDKSAPDHLLQAVDPLRAERQADGSLLVPIIGFAESSRRHTAQI